MAPDATTAGVDGGVVEELDAAVLRAWVVGARAAMAAARPRIDAVNVFPVADSDTGTNVLLTLDGGVAGVAALDERAPADAVARAFAHGAMLAARGNSGVILSQYLAGLARALSAAPGPQDVAEALLGAAQAAREAVADPQEGTVLTLADAVGARATRAVREGAGLVGLLEQVVADAHRGLARISAEHPVLRRAHVLDAGACALLVVLDALAGAVRGEPASDLAPDWLPVPVEQEDGLVPAGGAFEVMLLVRGDAVREDAVRKDAVREDAVREGAGPDDDRVRDGGRYRAGDVGAELRARMQELGDSVAVVGVDGWWHVHVHTDHPERAIDRAALGVREQVVVRLVETRPHETRPQESGPQVSGSQVSGPQHAPAAGDDVPWGVVVCTSSPSLAAWYASAGAVTVVRCPEAPITAVHLARAAADTGARQVALLPGDAVGGDTVAQVLQAQGPGVWALEEPVSEQQVSEQPVSEQRVPEQRVPEQRVPEQRVPEQRVSGALVPAALGAPLVEVLDATDELRSVVATQELVASPAGPLAAVLTLGRLRVAQIHGDLLDGVEVLLAPDGDWSAGRDPGRSVRAPGASAGGTLTVLHRDPLDAALPERLAATLAARTDGVEPVFVGPTGQGPAFVVGLD